MLNKICVMGRIIHDLNVKVTSNDNQYLLFTVAVERDYKNKQTNKRDADFIDVIAWSGLATFISKYFSKGAMICVAGRLESNDYTDQKLGVKMRRHKIVAENVYFTGEHRESSGGASAESAGGDFEIITEEDQMLPY